MIVCLPTGRLCSRTCGISHEGLPSVLQVRFHRRKMSQLHKSKSGQLLPRRRTQSPSMTALPLSPLSAQPVMRHQKLCLKTPRSQTWKALLAPIWREGPSRCLQRTATPSPPPWKAPPARPLGAAECSPQSRCPAETPGLHQAGRARARLPRQPAQTAPTQRSPDRTSRSLCRPP